MSNGNRGGDRLMAYVDVKRYGHIAWGPIGARPDAATVGEGQCYASTDTHAIFMCLEGDWEKIADLTAGIEWDDLLNKPDTYPPGLHDLEDTHTGSLGINRIRGHDQHDQAHLRNALMAMVIGEI